jgi:hypothetical protein
VGERQVFVHFDGQDRQSSMVQINFVPRRIAAFNRTNHVKAGGSPGLLAMLAVGSPRSCRDKRWIARGLSAGLRDHRPHHNLQWHLQKSSDRILNLVSLASVPSRNCCFFQSSTWSVVCLIVWRIGARAATYQIARDRENSSNESRRKCIGEQERSTYKIAVTRSNWRARRGVGCCNDDVTMDGSR